MNHLDDLNNREECPDTAVPPAGPVTVEVDFDPHVNYAMYQNDVPVIKRISVLNGTAELVQDIAVRAWLESELSEAWHAQIASVGAGATYNFDTIDLPLNAAVLARQTERERTNLVVEVMHGGVVLTRWVRSVDVLAFNEWPGVGSLPELMAAFVMPNHPAVQTVLGRAREHVERLTGQPALSGYQSTSEHHVNAMIESIYLALADENLGYINPPASYEQQGQKVRLPDELLQHKLGTCFDLALIMAACFEQVGLNPLIIMIDGHAFVGVWMSKQTFPEPATDQALRVRKRIQLGEIVAIEATAITSRPMHSFADAQRAALRHLDNVDRFICAIDVRAARATSIRPLPMRIAEGQIAVVPVNDRTPPSPTVDAPLTSASPPSDPANTPVPEAPSARLKRWKRRLLDLSLHNRVLNFRETAKSIPLLCPNVPRLEDVLAEGDRFALLPRPALMEEGQPRSSAVHLERTGEDAVEKLLLEDLAKRRLHANLTEQELERRLLELYRAARASIEESGTSTLYLAVGFLAWYESKSSDVRRLAPILLIPVELDRATAGSQFGLRQSDDEPRINVTLLEKLRSEFGLEAAGLDELTTDESGLDVAAIFRRFRELIKDEDRWDVVEEAQLGLFSFTKFLMWRDLQDRADSLMKNRVVRYLVERPDEAFTDESTFPSVDDLDTRRLPAETFCPRDADSSQLAAVYAAHDGHSFVLQGPPGTGKSQTITNLIAHCLSHDKRVLFVSEKMAALNVVHRRLTESGLAPFCLELHAHKANKRAVLAQLEASLNVAGQQPPAQWKRHAQKLTVARTALNDLVAALHRPRALGMSVYQVTSRLIGLRNILRLDLRIKNPAAIRESEFTRLREMVERLAGAASTVHDAATHPLRAIRRHVWQASLPDELLSRRNEAFDALQTLRECVNATLTVLELPVTDPSRAALDWLAELSDLLLQPPSPGEALLRESDWRTTRATLVDLIEQGRTRDERSRRLFERYQEEVLNEDVVALRGRLASAIQKWFLPRWLGARGVRQRMRLFLRTDAFPDNDELLRDLDELILVKRANTAMADPACAGTHYFGSIWSAGKADWSQLEAILTWIDRFDSLLSGGPADLTGDDAPNILMMLADAKRDRFTPNSTGGTALRDYGEAWRLLCQRLNALEQLLDVDADAAWSARDAAGAMSHIETTLANWRAHVGQLNDWCYWRRVRHDAREAGLSALIRSYETGLIQPEEFGDVFECTILRQWFNATCDAEDVLREFNSAEHHQRIERFRQLDREHLELSKQAIVAKLAAAVPQVYGEPSANSEMGILKRQLMLQRRHMPVRKLIQKLPHLLPRLKPCMLMGPLSVAQYLDTDFSPFDIVVFDEASQIPVWDAVGAIARGTEVIVVGDSKQLPPTNFFMKMNEEGVEDENDVEELESVLDECVASRIPAMRLRWHYRSRHESLIAFSNYHYYDNSLYTFPSPVAETQQLGVSMRFIESGVYDRGRSRTNRDEAEAVRDEIVQRLLEAGDSERKSIGIVTFSMAQQELIENLLDEARRAHPEIEPYFADDRLEPIFVKNLENVQGDERAVILFSICYAQDSAGKLPMTFGPVNRQGGERRLNVAITRAREQVIVFSSIRADQIDLSRTNSVGVKHLKGFLDYAQRGPSAIAEAVTLDPNATFDSPFERDVCEALEARGWQVDNQVGCSGYRIDLGVRDPDRPGAYLLGIECDGAFYHSGRTARDRDRLRQAVLESLGWTLFRIWSRDWWLNPQGVLAKLDAALGEAQREPQALIASAIPATAQRDDDDDEQPFAAASPAASPAVEFKAVPPGTFLYEIFKSGRVLGSGDAFYERTHAPRIRKLMFEILQQEAPMSANLLTRRIMPQWEIARQTSRVNRRVADLLDELERNGQVSVRDGFVWLSSQDPSTYSGFRVPASEEDRPRELEDVPSEELANACQAVLKQQISIPTDDLYRETARLFGINRVTMKSLPFVEAGLNILARRGECKIDGTMVTLARR